MSTGDFLKVMMPCFGLKEVPPPIQGRYCFQLDSKKSVELYAWKKTFVLESSFGPNVSASQSLTPLYNKLLQLNLKNIKTDPNEYLVFNAQHKQFILRKIVLQPIHTHAQVLLDLGKNFISKVNALEAFVQKELQKGSHV